MADIKTQAALEYEDGSCGKAALFAVKNATAGDTIELMSWFSIVKRAGMVSATGTTIASVNITSGLGGKPTLATIPAGVTQDGVWLLVVGVDS